MAAPEVSNNSGHFPNRLMAILDDEEVQKTMHWDAMGLAFTITKPDLFAGTVLQKYFKGVQFISFQKNLSYWGFKQTGEKIGGRFITLTFSHPLFLRDHPELANTMKRMSMKAWKAQRTPRMTDWKRGAELEKEEIEAENKRKAAILQQNSLPVILPIIPTWLMPQMTMANQMPPHTLQLTSRQVTPPHHLEIAPTQNVTQHYTVGNDAAEKACSFREHKMTLPQKPQQSRVLRSHPQNPKQVPRLSPLIHSLSVRDQPPPPPMQHEMPKPIQQQTLSRNELNAVIAMANMRHD